MHRTLAALISAAILAFLPHVATADEAGMRRLETADDSRGWDAVGRLDLGDRGFCTGALITPKLVLTAAHCLFDRSTGARFSPGEIRFLAGWRNGRAAAYRGVRRVLPHPDYVFSGGERLERVAHDLALLELDQPIRLPSIRPFETADPVQGEKVGVVSYAHDRSEAPTLEEVCEVLGNHPGVLVLSCSVDFGSSGAPIFAVRDGIPQIVSVVSAKAEMTGRKVALGTALGAPLASLIATMEGRDGVFFRETPQVVRLGRDPGAAGAKFLRPDTP